MALPSLAVLLTACLSLGAVGLDSLGVIVSPGAVGPGVVASGDEDDDRRLGIEKTLYVTSADDYPYLCKCIESAEVLSANTTLDGVCAFDRNVFCKRLPGAAHHRCGALSTALMTLLGALAGAAAMQAPVGG